MLEKGLALRPDVLMPDLEDSVPLSEKGAARESVSGFLPRMLATGVPVMPRVNSVESRLLFEDVKTVVQRGGGWSLETSSSFP